MRALYEKTPGTALRIDHEVGWLLNPRDGGPPMRERTGEPLVAVGIYVRELDAKSGIIFGITLDNPANATN